MTPEEALPRIQEAMSRAGAEGRLTVAETQGLRFVKVQLYRERHIPELVRVEHGYAFEGVPVMVSTRRTPLAVLRAAGKTIRGEINVVYDGQQWHGVGCGDARTCRVGELQAHADPRGPGVWRLTVMRAGVLVLSRLVRDMNAAKLLFAEAVRAAT